MDAKVQYIIQVFKYKFTKQFNGDLSKYKVVTLNYKPVYETETLAHYHFVNTSEYNNMLMTQNGTYASPTKLAQLAHFIINEKGQIIKNRFGQYNLDEFLNTEVAKHLYMERVK